MTAHSLPCPSCSGTRESTHEDRHAGTRMDVCRTCEVYSDLASALIDMINAIDAKRKIWSRSMGTEKRMRLSASNDAHHRRAEAKARDVIAAYTALITKVPEASFDPTAPTSADPAPARDGVGR